RSGAGRAARPWRARLRGAPVVGACSAVDGSASATRHRAGRLTMRITITARHCELPPELRARARALVERLARVAARPPDARVVFVADHGRPAVEVRLTAARGRLTVGAACGGGQNSMLNSED